MKRMWGYTGLFNGFTDTLQWVTGLFGRVQNLIHLGGRHIAGINTTNSFAVQVDLEHDLRGRPRSLLKNSWITMTTNSMGVKSSLSIATWYIWGGSIFWARLSRTTASPPSGARGVTVGSVGWEGFFVAMISFYRGFQAL